MAFDPVLFFDAGDDFDQDTFSQLMMDLFCMDPEHECILKNQENELFIHTHEDPVDPWIAVDTGCALVHGTYYENTSLLPFHLIIPISPSSSVSASVSPSTSESPSLSASVSPSLSESHSLSKSPSASLSISASRSISPSGSVSPSVSKSVSGSRSISPSASASPTTPPGFHTFYYSLKLWKDWTSQTVRLVLLGPEGSSIPEGQFIPGSVWAVDLSEIRVTEFGTITMIDKRRYLTFNRIFP